MSLPMLICPVTAIEIKQGITIEGVSKAMQSVGYDKSGRAIAATDKKNGLVTWSVERGTLVVAYSLETMKVVGVSYWLSDERPKATRKTFRFTVTSFDTETGLITLKTRKPERLQVEIPDAD